MGERSEQWSHADSIPRKLFEVYPKRHLEERLYSLGISIGACYFHPRAMHRFSSTVTRTIRLANDASVK